MTKKKRFITKKTPDFSLEKKAHLKYVAGVDEAGCGPWAGPVIAAAVVFLKYDEDNWPDLNDSKKLSPQRREKYFQALLESKDVLYGIGEASVAEIDSLNIGNATRLAMERALANLSITPDHVLVDGIRKPSIDIPFTTVIKGDSLSLSIAAASIIAKVTRDHIMQKLEKDYPMYHWAKNAGYGTALHQDALKNYGVTAHHRRSFAPIRTLLEAAA